MKQVVKQEETSRDSELELNK